MDDNETTTFFPAFGYCSLQNIPICIKDIETNNKLRTYPGDRGATLQEK